MTKARTDPSVLLLVDSTPDAVRASGVVDIPWTVLHTHEPWNDVPWDVVILPSWLPLLGNRRRSAAATPLWIGYGEVEQLQPVIDRGAADFLVSPWAASEGYARALATYRRSSRCAAPVLTGRRLSVGDEEMLLPPAEARVLALLMERTNGVVPRDMLMSAAGVRSLDVCISKLRRRIAPFFQRCEVNCEIQTEFGLGYVFRSVSNVDKLWKTPRYGTTAERCVGENEKKVQRNIVSRTDKPT